MNHAELLVKANEQVFEARIALQAIYKVGLEKPVPAESFAAVRHLLTGAAAAVQELENRAKGMAEPKHG